VGKLRDWELGWFPAQPHRRYSAREWFNAVLVVLAAALLIALAALGLEYAV
jgi:hypothetical protein